MGWSWEDSLVPQIPLEHHQGTTLSSWVQGVKMGFQRLFICSTGNNRPGVGLTKCSSADQWTSKMQDLQTTKYHSTLAEVGSPVRCQVGKTGCCWEQENPQKQSGQTARSWEDLGVASRHSFLSGVREPSWTWMVVSIHAASCL